MTLIMIYDRKTQTNISFSLHQLVIIIIIIQPLG